MPELHGERAREMTALLRRIRQQPSEVDAGRLRRLMAEHLGVPCALSLKQGYVGLGLFATLPRALPLGVMHALDEVVAIDPQTGLVTGIVKDRYGDLKVGDRAARYVNAPPPPPPPPATLWERLDEEFD